MGRTVIGWTALLALAITTSVAEARDRKPAAHEHERDSLSHMIPSRPTLRHDGFSPARANATSPAAMTDSSAPKPNGKPAAPISDHEPVQRNPFRLNIGRVAVQPTIGGIKGAQFSIGF